jgi:hypothetical protein
MKKNESDPHQPGVEAHPADRKPVHRPDSDLKRDIVTRTRFGAGRLLPAPAGPPGVGRLCSELGS